MHYIFLCVLIIKCWKTVAVFVSKASRVCSVILPLYLSSKCLIRATTSLSCYNVTKMDTEAEKIGLKESLKQTTF